MDSMLLSGLHPSNARQSVASRARRPLRQRIGGFRALDAAGDACVTEEALSLWSRRSAPRPTRAQRPRTTPRSARRSDTNPRCSSAPRCLAQKFREDYQILWSQEALPQRVGLLRDFSYKAAKGVARSLRL